MMSGRWRGGTLALLLVAGVAPADAAPAIGQVLLLQSFDRGNITLDYFTGNFRVELHG